MKRLDAIQGKTASDPGGGVRPAATDLYVNGTAYKCHPETVDPRGPKGTRSLDAFVRVLRHNRRAPRSDRDVGEVTRVQGQASTFSRAGSGDTACRGLPASRGGNGRTGAASLAFRVWRVKNRQEASSGPWSARAISPGPGRFTGRRRGRGTRPGSAGDQRSPEGHGDDAASPRRWWGSIFRTAALR
jgi:hypothetical protein